MGGNTNYPTALDNDSSLVDVQDGVSSLQAVHHNNLKEAIKEMQAKIGINHTNVPTSLDFRLGSATGSHNHNGASGQGAPIDIPIPSGGYPSGGTLHDHLMTPARYIVQLVARGIASVGTNVLAPVVMGRTMQLEAVNAGARVGASGATLSLDIKIDDVSVWDASIELRPVFAPGATVYGHASPNLITYPSGGVITVDVNTVGSSAPGSDISLNLIFRD